MTRLAPDLALTPALELSNVTKHYGRTTAVASANLVVRPGTVHALLGENGAGKTTLMRVAYGMVRADAGEIRVAGRKIFLATPADAIHAGIGMVHQHFTLVPAMTVAENIALGGHGRLRAAEIVNQVEDLAERTGFTLNPHARIEDLAVGAQQRVEIAKALARNAKVLILDEPTAVLAPAETEDLLRWLRMYVEEGRSVILITHKLRDALSVADDLTVLRSGRTVFSGAAVASSVQQLTSAMLGSALVPEKTATADRHADAGAPVITAERVSIIDSSGRVCVREASLMVRAGERVGIAAVEGSGQRELLRALAGRLSISSGRLELPAVVGFVPEDRHADALLLDASLVENIALRGAGQRQGIMPWRTLRSVTSDLIEQHDVRARDASQPARTLSGGNQQKLVFARELEATTDQPAPHALVVENPTRGLDVHASRAVHDRLREASANGTAVLLYSSDLDEVLALATRVVVMFGGTLLDTPLDRRVIGEAMLGVHADTRQVSVHESGEWTR